MAESPLISDLLVSIVTPQSTLLDQFPARMAVVPGNEGNLGIMARHTPLVTALRNGEIKIFRSDSEPVFTMSNSDGGVLYVTDEGARILLEEFCPLSAPEFSLKGASHMPQQLKVESAKFGSYKIDADVLPLLTPALKHTLTEHLTHRPGTIITKALVDNLLKPHHHSHHKVA